MPALWTTTSTPPWRSRTCAASASGACSAVMSSCSAVPRTRLAVSARSAPIAGMSRQIDGGAVAREHLGDRRADAARRAGDERDLAGERALPVLRGGSGARPDRDHLAVDVGGAAGEQEPQRRLDAVLRAGRDPDELRRGAGAQLLGRGAREALQRALGDGGAHAAGRRPAASRAPAAGRSGRAGGCAGAAARRPRAGPRSARSPDASSRIAPSGSVSSARSRASSPAAFAAARAWRSATQVSAPIAASTRAAGSASRPPGAAVSSAGDSSTGAPGSCRRSGTGSGRPRRRTTRRPGLESANCW